MISAHLARLSLRLFTLAHAFTLSSSAVLVCTLSDGMIAYVSSAYLHSTLLAATFSAFCALLSSLLTNKDDDDLPISKINKQRILLKTTAISTTNND